MRRMDRVAICLALACICPGSGCVPSMLVGSVRHESVQFRDWGSGGAGLRVDAQPGLAWGGMFGLVSDAAPIGYGAVRLEFSQHRVTVDGQDGEAQLVSFGFSGYGVYRRFGRVHLIGTALACENVNISGTGGAEGLSDVFFLAVIKGSVGVTHSFGHSSGWRGEARATVGFAPTHAEIFGCTIGELAASLSYTAGGRQYTGIGYRLQHLVTPQGPSDGVDSSMSRWGAFLSTAWTW